MRSSLRKLFKTASCVMAVWMVCAHGDVKFADAAKAPSKRFAKGAGETTKVKNKLKAPPKISPADREKVRVAFERGEEKRILDYFNTAGRLTGVPPSVLAGICVIESCIDPDARTYGGAERIMQIMPQTYVIYVATALSDAQKGKKLIDTLERHAPRSAKHLRTLLPLIVRQAKEPYDIYRQIDRNTRAQILRLRERKEFGDESTFLEIFFAAHDMAARVEKLPAQLKKNSYLYRVVHMHTDVQKALGDLKDSGASARFHAIVEESKRRLRNYDQKNAAFMNYCEYTEPGPALFNVRRAGQPRFAKG